MQKNSIIMIFLDGVGIGLRDADKNPFFKYRFSLFKDVFGAVPHNDAQFLQKNGNFLFPADALMNVEGIPQSGTGQASIFCGVNGPLLAGRHFGPFPPSALMETIKEQNIMLEFSKRGGSVSFLNAYPQIFFDYLSEGKRRLSVSSLMCFLNGNRLNRITDLRKGRALSAEINNERWVSRLGYKLPVIRPETAAARLLRIASKNNFVLFEYYLTDHLGHGRNMHQLEETLMVLDKFLYFVISNLNKDMTLLICSDHGNLEDISIKGHTVNPALTIAAGRGAEKLADKIKKLSDIKNSLLGLYG